MCYEAGERYTKKVTHWNLRDQVPREDNVLRQSRRRYEQHERQDSFQECVQRSPPKRGQSSQFGTRMLQSNLSSYSRRRRSNQQERSDDRLAKVMASHLELEAKLDKVEDELAKIYLQFKSCLTNHDNKFFEESDRLEKEIEASVTKKDESESSSMKIEEIFECGENVSQILSGKSEKEESHKNSERSERPTLESIDENILSVECYESCEDERGLNSECLERPPLKSVAERKERELNDLHTNINSLLPLAIDLPLQVLRTIEQEETTLQSSSTHLSSLFTNAPLQALRSLQILEMKLNIPFSTCSSFLNDKFLIFTSFKLIVSSITFINHDAFDWLVLISGFHDKNCSRSICLDCHPYTTEKSFTFNGFNVLTYEDQLSHFGATLRFMSSRFNYRFPTSDIIEFSGFGKTSFDNSCFMLVTFDSCKIGHFGRLIFYDSELYIIHAELLSLNRLMLIVFIGFTILGFYGKHTFMSIEDFLIYSNHLRDSSDYLKYFLSCENSIAYFREELTLEQIDFLDLDAFDFVHAESLFCWSTLHNLFNRILMRRGRSPKFRDSLLNVPSYHGHKIFHPGECELPFLVSMFEFLLQKPKVVIGSCALMFVPRLSKYLQIRGRIFLKRRGMI